MAPHYRYRDTLEQMQLTKITGQWQPLKPIDSVGRWIFLDKKDFDPERFLQDLATAEHWGRTINRRFGWQFSS